jgi:hypothetical protein
MKIHLVNTGCIMILLGKREKSLLKKLNLIAHPEIHVL